MEKYLITGFAGFVGMHFLKFLEMKGERAEVLGIDVQSPDPSSFTNPNISFKFKKVNLLDRLVVEEILQDFQPDYILHLASYSSVAYSWQYPVESFVNNTNIFLNLIETIRLLKLNSRLLSIGSSEEYGNVKEDALPLKEEEALRPLSPYAVARVSQEMLTKVYADSYGLDIILTRSFNHIGPGQRDAFVIPSFAKQLVNIKRTNTRGTLEVGDISIIRDFIDVRDVVHAYYLLFKKGRKGEIYNICTGKGVKLSVIIEQLIAITNLDIDIVINNNLVRPNDNKIIVGSNEKIKKEVGWNANFSLKQSLFDVVRYWQEK